jgi:radical SAM-linked protein
MTDNAIIRYNAHFRKKDRMVYISHLNLMTLFRRAIRRAGLPFVLTKGFTPRIKISMPKALKMGQESESEEFSFWLSRAIDPDSLTSAINSELPEGISILKVEKGR